LLGRRHGHLLVYSVNKTKVILKLGLLLGGRPICAKLDVPPKELGHSVPGGGGEGVGVGGDVSDPDY
jgi:hypothetical protein